MAEYVAYLRVSTRYQARSGLGLEAQRTAIARFLSPSDVLIDEFVEVESGRRNDRVALGRAMLLAKRRGAPLLIARLDRFSRRVSFIASVMEAGIRLVIAEMPHATEFQLHIFAALAQEERRLISMRTRQALAAAKARGRTLGRAGGKRAEENRVLADSFALSLGDRFYELRHLSHSELARALNAAGLLTRQGCLFSPQTVVALRRRLDRLEGRDLPIANEIRDVGLEGG